MENIKLEEMDMVKDVEVIDLYPETNGGAKIGKLAIGLGVAAVGTVITLACKNRSKIEEWKINRFRKKGYEIYKVEDLSEEKQNIDSEE